MKPLQRTLVPCKSPPELIDNVSLLISFLFWVTLHVKHSLVFSMNNKFLYLLLDMLENSTGETSSAGWDHQFEFLQKLWSHVRQLKYEEMVELITHPSVVLFDAVNSGNVKLVNWLLYMNRELLTIKDPENGWNTLHFAVLYRQHDIFNFILKMATVNATIRAMDNDRNNVLHIAAHQSEEISTSLRPNIEMQKDLEWFKVVFYTYKHMPYLYKKKNSNTCH